jgi:hypothetical protein
MEMNAIEEKSKERATALSLFLAKPFNLDNSEQLKTIKKYNDDFEFALNQTYLFQAGLHGMPLGFIGYILPLPQFVTHSFAGVFWLGAASLILKCYSIKEFNEQLLEMKEIYKWCSNNIHEIDKSKTLSNPEIQRLIKLIAPLCDTKFMVTWSPVESLASKQDDGWINMLWRNKPTIEANHTRELKSGVEKRSFDVGVLQGLFQAITYFSQHEIYKGMMSNIWSGASKFIMQFAPNPLANNITPQR